VDQGRLTAGMGLDTGLAYFEWSAADDCDVTDPQSWWGFHPALGFTIEEETIVADLASMPLPEWRRAYANQWLSDTDAAGWAVISRDTWLKAQI